MGCQCHPACHVYGRIRGYCTDGDKEELKELLRRGVEYAAVQDMYVIVDWHILSDNDPNLHKAEALTFFDEMTK